MSAGIDGGAPTSDQAASPGAAGRFVWHDLMTPDPDASRAFYTELFGWQITSVPMGAGTYQMIRAGGEGQGGIEKIPHAGAPPHWLGYVTVDDVDAVTESAKGAGGQVHLEPTDIPEVGRFAIIGDPTGAVIAPFRSQSGDMPEPEAPPSPGQFCWDELLSNDAQACGPFYANLFAWRQESMDMGDMTYHIFKRRNAQDGSGMLQMPAEAQAPSHWLPYIAVEDVDATCEKAVSIGATLYKEPGDIPHVGRFAVLGDPQGASFAIFRGVPQEDAC